MLVDSDDGVVEPVARCLGGLYAVARVSTVAAARVFLRRHRVDLVILEARLGEDSGLVLVAHIRRLYPTTPIVMLTAFGSEAICAAAFRVGIADYLPKPVDGVALFATVARLARRPPRRMSWVPLPRRWPGPAPATRGEQRVHDAARYIDAHSDQSITLTGVARAVGMGPFSLSHAFTAVMQVSFRTYLLRRRVRHACDLLGDPSRSVTDIGQTVGFGDVSRFNKVFKKYAGLSPTAWRRRAMARSARTKAGNALPRGKTHR